jgi:aspartate 4-decarboxylase
MALFAAFDLLDKQNQYRQLTKDICRRRMKLLYAGLGLPQPTLSFDADYYTQFDLEEWSTNLYGKEFTCYLQRQYTPVDILFHLAEKSSIVLLNAAGFHGPTWSIRVSLANLDDNEYANIGQELRKLLDEYVKNWKNHETNLLS